MKKIILACSLFSMFTACSFASVSFGIEQETILPTIEQSQSNSYKKQEKLEIKDATRTRTYDNVPIFNTGDKKINIILKQPNAMLGTQQ